MRGDVTMRMHRNNVIGIAAVLLVCCCFPRPGYGFEDAIIAVVNEETITLKDLQDYFNAVYTQLKMDGRHSPEQIQEIMEQVEREGINRLIDDRLVLSAANKRGIEANRSAVDQRISETRSRYPSEQAFLSALTAEGLTVTDLRQRIADQLKSQFFVEMEIKSAIQVHPQEVTDYYKQNLEQFVRPEHVDLNSIFIPYGDDPQEAREQANMVYGRIKMGDDFQEAVASYSKAPSLGKIARGEMKPDIEEQIFSLKSGAVTPPIESDQGVFIFQLKEKFPATAVKLDEVKDQISQFLFNRKFKEKMGAWLNEARQETYIEIKKM